MREFTFLLKSGAQVQAQETAPCVFTLAITKTDDTLETVTWMEEPVDDVQNGEVISEEGQEAISELMKKIECL